ncbi:hypothetical protein Toil_gp19 [Rhodococcus phage Toil]|uniref:Uncharacterized protein n=1 Tax=Rhodococcus phage Toil TaxID=1975614 RepID=A0A1W6DY67_9VIRU|nr:hypothetical protein KMD62_gp19 [Rhodococcus phage Toil]ARK07702.1 hypothetical protein Toil_gp19 [Rhodococcus phage Toil]
MFGFFGKKKTVDPGADNLEAQLVIPVDLNEAHSYVRPGASEYPSPPVYGVNPYATKVGTDLPTIKNQDEILVHYMQPPAARNPQQWYEDRNVEILRLSRQQEYFQTASPPEFSAKQGTVVQPWESTPKNPRVTGGLAQSNYRFVRPFDQRFARNLNGNVGSQAALNQSYPFGGLQGQRNFRNTVRLEPPNRDAENYDLSGTQTASPVPAVYVSPQVSNERRYGL